MLSELTKSSWRQQAADILFPIFLDITQDDIDGAINDLRAGKYTKCPAQRAAERQFETNTRTVSVGMRIIEVYDGNLLDGSFQLVNSYSGGKELLTFTSNYDNYVAYLHGYTRTFHSDEKVQPTRIRLRRV